MGHFLWFSPFARVREERSGLFFVHLRRSVTPTHGCVAHDAAQPVAYHHSEQKNNTPSAMCITTIGVIQMQR